MFEQTQPTRRTGVDSFQPVPVARAARGQTKAKHPWRLFFTALVLVYFFGPLRTNVLLLGTDDSPLRDPVGRTDTIILTTVVPLRPYIGMMGIPRDLWLPIPGVGEQRINTAYFFAEAASQGSGAEAVMGAVRQNFGVPVHYYALLHMEGMISVIDTLGGVDIVLEHKMGGMKKGTYHMDGTQALAFARDRSSADDFSRMQQGQVVLQAVGAKLLSPLSWPRLPAVLFRASQAVDTNIPIWQWPRLGFSLIRAGIFGVDARTTSPEMVDPWITSGGAQVLTPNWDAIRPWMSEMFGN